MNVPDNYDMYVEHSAEQEKKLNQLPECSYCSEKITDDYVYIIGDEFLCEDCLNDNYRRPTEIFIN